MEFLHERPEPRRRDLCFTCLQPKSTCYCKHVKQFDPKIHFVILIHPIEVRRRIATGRMSHLCLKNSRLIQGHDFSRNESVNQILNDPKNHCVILYPGRASTNLTPLNVSERAELFPADKELVIFVLDGTWSTASKMLRHSQNLLTLPQIGFIPQKPSNFRVRQQPKPNFYSTIEAIHHTLELVGPARGFNLETREQDHLLFVFDKMVEQQLFFIAESHRRNTHSRHRRKA